MVQHNSFADVVFTACRLDPAAVYRRCTGAPPAQQPSSAAAAEAAPAATAAIEAATGLCRRAIVDSLCVLGRFELLLLRSTNDGESFEAAEEGGCNGGVLARARDHGPGASRPPPAPECVVWLGADRDGWEREQQRLQQQLSSSSSQHKNGGGEEKAAATGNAVATAPLVVAAAVELSAQQAAVLPRRLRDRRFVLVLAARGKEGA